MTSLFKSPLFLLIATLLVPAALLAQAPSASSASAGWGAAPQAGALAGPAPAQALPAPVTAGSDDHILMPGDLINVKVFQEPDLESTLRIAQDGAVVFPLIGRVNVGGQTPQAAAKLIQNLLDKDYLVNPHVNLLVIEYARRSFTVLGEVQKPGSYDMPDRSTVSLLEAIGISGGYTRTANSSNVTVKRRVNDKETIFRLNAKRMAASSGSNATFEIQSGDVITVAESIF